MPIKTPSPSTPRLTPQEFDAVLAAKGWTKKAAATRWGITPVWVSNISRDPARPPHWDDAVLGLPNHRFLERNEKRRRELVAALTGQAQARDQHKTTGGFRYHHYLAVGSIVTATENIGGNTEAGARGIVFGVKKTGQQESYGVVFETGMIDWFPPLYVDKLLASTGLVDEASSKIRLHTDEDALVRFRSGQFNFR